MELILVANREYIVRFVNDFLLKNSLIYFDDSNFRKNGVKFGKCLDKEYLNLNRDFLIYIGSEDIFCEKIKNSKNIPGIKDKYDFIYLMNLRTKNELKITETSFIWAPTRSESAKKTGKMIKKEIVSNCNVGMEVVDAENSGYNKYLKKFYWPEEVLEYNELLYSPVNVQIVPTLDRLGPNK